MKKRIDSESCSVCNMPLVLNYLPDTGPNSGVCNECGMVYLYDNLDDDPEVKCTYNEDVPDHKVAVDYYTKTGNIACIVGHIEVSDDKRKVFNNWVNEKYNMYWGKSAEEIPDEEL